MKQSNLTQPNPDYLVLGPVINGLANTKELNNRFPEAKIALLEK